MLIFLYLCFLSLSLANCREPEKFVISLDIDPQHRYSQLASAKQKNIVKFLDHLHTYPIYKNAFKVAKALSPLLKHYVGAQFYSECQSIAKPIRRHISQIVVFNFMYELGAYHDFCTSISVQMGEGYFLARNLDYGFQQYLADNSVVLTYTKNSVPVAMTVGHAGLIGVHTGLRLNSYSVTLNERVDGGLHRTLIKMFTSRIETVPYLLRKVILTESDPFIAISRLRSTKTYAAVYFIVNFEGRNVIIEKQREGVKAVYANEGFLVQTNTDRQLADPDNRRNVAQLKMEAMMGGKNLSQEGVWKILEQSPNKNNLTLLTVLLDTKNSTLRAFVWESFEKGF